MEAKLLYEGKAKRVYETANPDEVLISYKDSATAFDGLKATQAWVFLFCIEMIFALVNRTVLDMYSFPFIAFTYGPLLYLYVRHMIRPSLTFAPTRVSIFSMRRCLAAKSARLRAACRSWLAVRRKVSPRPCRRLNAWARMLCMSVLPEPGR